MLASLPGVINAFLVLGILMGIWSIMGVQFFKGIFWYCNDGDVVDVDQCWGCFADEEGGNPHPLCPEGSSRRVWRNARRHFLAALARATFRAFVLQCAADLAAPAGLLDLQDITAFVNAFQNGDAVADVGAVFGLLDLQDIVAFVQGSLDVYRDELTSVLNDAEADELLKDRTEEDVNVDDCIIEPVDKAVTRAIHEMQMRMQDADLEVPSFL